MKGFRKLLQFTAFALLSANLVPAVAQELKDTAVVARTAADSLSGKTKERSIQLGEATVKATRLMLITKKDTVIYDMDALGPSANDLLGDMIARMPGLELRDGALYFNGKAVDRLKINGTDFIRGDTKQMLEAIPASLIKSVRAYESHTDETLVTGLDDGRREQVVDVVLKKKLKDLWAGNADLGYGLDNYYRARVFLNNFSDNHRLSFFGGFTNTGEYQTASFSGSWNDIGAGSSSGLTTFMRPGLSTMWQNKKYEAGEAGFYKIEFSANWDYRGHNDYSWNSTDLLLSDGSRSYEIGDNRSKDDERIWSGNLYLTLQPFRHTHIEINPSFSYTSQTSRSHRRLGVWSVPVDELYASPLDSLFDRPDEGWPDTGVTSARRREIMKNQDRYHYRHWIWGTQRLTKNNMRLSLRSTTNYSYSPARENDLSSYRYYTVAQGQPDPLYNRYSEKGNHNFFTQNFLDLDIPVPSLQALRLTYGYEKYREHEDDDGYRLERAGGIFADPDAYLEKFGHLPSEEDWRAMYRDAEIMLNSIMMTRRHWAEVKLSYKKNGLYVDLQNTARFRHAEMDYVKGDYDPLDVCRNDLSYGVYSGIRYDTDSLGKYRFNYQFEINPQNLFHFITIPDESDPTSIVLGNAALKATRSHSLRANYDCVLKNGKMFNANLIWNVYINEMSRRTTYNKETNVRVSRPDNFSGHWSVNLRTNLTLPLDAKQKFTLSISPNYYLNHLPRFVTAVEGESYRQVSVRHNLGLNTNFQLHAGKLYAAAGVGIGYRMDHEPGVAGSDVSSWSNIYYASLQYTLPGDVEVKTAMFTRHTTSYAGTSWKPVRTVWDLSVSKTLLRSKALSVKAEVSDLLNQRSQYGSDKNSYKSASWYVQTVGRIFMAHLIYRFSAKK